MATIDLSRAIVRTPVRRDPGVQVPNIGGAEGRGLQQLGGTVTQAAAQVGTRQAQVNEAQSAAQAAARERITRNQEALDRIKIRSRTRDQIRDEYNRVQTEQDISDPEVVREFGAKVRSILAESVAQHAGSDESALQLEAQLESEVISPALGQAAGDSLAAKNAIAERHFSELANDLAARVRGGDDPRAVIQDGVLAMQADADAFTELQQQAFTDSIESIVWRARAEDLISTGGFNAAESLVLDNPEVRRSLSPEVQRSVLNQIDAGRKAEKTARDNQVIGVMSTEEKVALGLRPDMVVTKKGNGDFDIKFTPSDDETETDKTIKSLVDQGFSEEEAGNIARGIIEYKVTDQGRVLKIDNAIGAVEEQPISLGGAAAGAGAQEDQVTIWDQAALGNVAGVAGGVKELVGRTVGQVADPGGDVLDAVAQRQFVEINVRDAIRALALNPRFTEGEQKRIRETLQLSPSIFQSTPSMLAGLQALDTAVQQFLADEERIANNPNLPDDVRGESGARAEMLRSFIGRLGVPENIDEVISAVALPPGVPEGSTRLGLDDDGFMHYLAPDGRQLRWVPE